MPGLNGRTEVNYYDDTPYWLLPDESESSFLSPMYTKPNPTQTDKQQRLAWPPKGSTTNKSVDELSGESETRV
ncbi:unnamed protein product [Protopolystoma xenopodis]|uniref:Uncharacterized protein n=1 Tax=Protopolystoma xenopodis TaxID=117903 RepID=A0A3S5AQB1_9PLAT|nr:unnamed protein product [Protopolystoma xenopodis]